MKLINSILLAVTVSTTACVVTTNDTPDSSLLVNNQSDFTIHEMYITDVNSSSWGDNLLGRDVLFPGESMNLGLDCGTYDALLVDETNAMCEIYNLNLCFDDADWIIRNNSCAVFEARAAQNAKDAAEKKAQTDAATMSE